MNLSTAAAIVWASATSLLRVVHAGNCYKEGVPFHQVNWKYCQEISDTLHMYYTPLNDTIMLGLHATEGVTGWSSLAPAGNGGMKGASQIVVRKDEATDEWIAEDRYSMEYQMPSMDEKQDVQLLFAQQDEDTGETAWGVVIPQNSCDEPYDYAIEDRNTFMLWALGNSHPFSFHGADRGQFTANLMGPPPTTIDLDSYDSVDLLMPNVPVVRGEKNLDPMNPFICSYFDMNVMGEEMGFTEEDKVHMVGYEPVITEGNSQFIHHLTLFTCEGYSTIENGQAGTTQLDDSNLEHQTVIPACTNMPPGCSNMVAAWAIGADSPAFPEDVGFPIGEGQRWMVMQMHYYNPNMVKDVMDSSGVRLYLTKDLRPIDGAIMHFVVGTQTGQHPPLPGGKKDIAMETLYAEPDCTKQWTEPLTVMDVAHHSHFKGTHQEIIVERDGKNLGPMRKEFRFDYNHQTGLEPVSALHTLYPGDRLAATCHFDTSDVPEGEEVQIGEESNKEMCYPTFSYYPKQKLTGFMYYPPEVISPWYIRDLEWCSSPSDDESLGSLCAEKLWMDVTDFYNQTFMYFEYDGESFDYPSMCNGEGAEFAESRKVLPICPEECSKTQSCSDEELRLHTQGVCAYSCGMFGLSVYPDTSRTEAYNTASVLCPNAFFNAPTLAEPDACQVKGVLPQTIELVDPDANVGVKDSSWNSFAALLLLGVYYAGIM